MMMSRFRSTLAATAFAAAALILPSPHRACAETAASLRAEARAALASLYSQNPGARALGEKAAGVLVFPSIVKGGFVVAGQYGKGVLTKGGKTAGYYNSVLASYGFEAGLQKFGYAMFFMNKAALNYLDKSGGWELGVGPTITVIDQGAAVGLSTSTAQNDIYLSTSIRRA